MDTQQAVQELKAERVQEELMAVEVAEEELSWIWLKAERVQEALAGDGSQGTEASVLELAVNRMDRVAFELLAPRIVITVHGTKAGGGVVGAAPATTASDSR